MFLPNVNSKNYFSIGSCIVIMTRYSIISIFQWNVLTCLLITYNVNGIDLEPTRNDLNHAQSTLNRTKRSSGTGNQKISI